MYGGAECTALVMLLPDGGMQVFFTVVKKNGEQSIRQDEKMRAMG